MQQRNVWIWLQWNLRELLWSKGMSSWKWDVFKWMQWWFSWETLQNTYVFILLKWNYVCIFFVKRKEKTTWNVYIFVVERHINWLIRFIACPHGYFGKDCVNTCNITCDGCNNVHGLCDSGCYPGWKGNYCGEGKYIYLIATFWNFPAKLGNIPRKHLHYVVCMYTFLLGVRKIVLIFR